MEKELCRLIEPYSFVQISHIASTIGLPVDKVEKKLAQMILDVRFKLRRVFECSLKLEVWFSNGVDPFCYKKNTLKIVEFIKPHL